MHIVDSMAYAYVVQREHPDWDAFVLRLPESGIYEIEDGPVQIITRYGRLYGDTTCPVRCAIIRSLVAMTIGWSFGQLVGGAGIVWFFILAVNAVGLVALNRIENVAIGRALHDGMGFFREVQRLSGPDRAYAALKECVKGVSDGGSTKDGGQPEVDWKARQRDASEVGPHDDGVR
jgi:hypothetical protein